MFHPFESIVFQTSIDVLRLRDPQRNVEQHVGVVFARCARLISICKVRWFKCRHLGFDKKTSPIKRWISVWDFPSTSKYPPGNEHIPQKWQFEDDFPFPQVGYVNSLEGTSWGERCLRRYVFLGIQIISTNKVWPEAQSWTIFWKKQTWLNEKTPFFWKILP